MPLKEVTREGVEMALKEFDHIGRDAMLAKYGGRPSTKWHIEREGNYYDQKLVLRAAHLLQGLGAIPLGRGAFTTLHARKHIKRLGFRGTGQIQIRGFPVPLMHKIVERLAQHTVGFLRLQTPSGPPELLGSGVLVSAGNTRAVLTAHHVIEVIDKLSATERLGLLLEKTNQPHTINKDGVALRKIARGRNALGPDLGALILAPPIASSIEFSSMKSFYNLDKRRDQMLHAAPDLRMGAWVAQGLIQEKTIVTPLPDGRGASVLFKGDGLFGGPENVEEIGGYDYLDYPVTPLAREMTPSLPRTWGGMSGSGLWQIPLKANGANLEVANSEFDTPLLSGVVFRQRKVDGEMWIRCHGRKSVYQRALGVLMQSAGQ